MKRLKRLAVKLSTGEVLEADIDATAEGTSANRAEEITRQLRRPKGMDYFYLTSGGVVYNVNPDHVVWTVVEIEDVE